MNIFSLSSCHLFPNIQMIESKRGFWFPLLTTLWLYFMVAEKLEFCFHCIFQQMLGSQNWTQTWNPSVVYLHHNAKFLWGKVLSSVLAVEGSLCIIIHHSLHSGLMLEALKFQRFICKDLFIYFPTDPLNTPSPLCSNLCERFK